MQEGAGQRLFYQAGDTFAIHPFDVVVGPKVVVVLGEYTDLGEKPNLKLSDMIGVWVDSGRPPRVILKPDTALSYRGIAGFFDGKGRLVTVWGETTERLRPDSTKELVVTFYRAAFDGKTWVVPATEISDAQHFPTEHPMTLVRDGRGRMHAFEESSQDLLHFVFDGDSLRREATKRLPSGFGYLTAAAHDSAIFLAYSRGDFESPGDINSLFFTRSFDYGASFSSESKVYKSAGRRADTPRLVRAPDGELRLFFTRSASHVLGTERTIALFTSKDGGETWVEQPELKTPSGALTLRIETDNCGVSWAFWTTWDFSRPEPHVAVLFAAPWKQDGWGPIHTFPDVPDFFSGWSRQAFLPNGTLLRAYSSVFVEKNDLHYSWTLSVIR